MTDNDLLYLKKMLAAGYVQSPCLQMGVALAGTSVAAVLQTAGLAECRGTDLVAGEAVDFVVDFEASPEAVQVGFRSHPTWASILCFNVLEHTVNPVQVLDNITLLLVEGGTAILSSPARWPIHDYPIDCWRLLPGFYVEYAKHRKLELVVETFEYLGYGPVEAFRTKTGYRFPPPARSRFYRIYSHIVHRLFGTFGRAMWFPELLAIGVVFRKH